MRYEITPVPAPRMTRADRWKKRDCVMRYFAFRDEVKRQNVKLENSSHITFVMPTKVKSRHGKPHQMKPDVDNLYKALSDSVYTQDCELWDMRITKVWGESGAIIITPIN